MRRFNAVLLHGSLPAADCTDWWSYLVLLSQFQAPSETEYRGSENKKKNKKKKKRVKFQWLHTDGLESIRQPSPIHLHVWESRQSSGAYGNRKSLKHSSLLTHCIFQHLSLESHGPINNDDTSSLVLWVASIDGNLPFWPPSYRLSSNCCYYVFVVMVNKLFLFARPQINVCFRWLAWNHASFGGCHIA